MLAALAVLAAVQGCGWRRGGEAQADAERSVLRARREAALAETGAGAGPLRPGLMEGEAAEGKTPRPRPDWAATGVSARYPSAAYLVGVGAARADGPNEEAAALADERARAELARQVRARIRSAVVSETDFAASRGEASKETTAVFERIASETDVRLEGVRIAERWRNPETGAWWSLAVLDRLRFARRLRERVESLRADTEQARAQFDEADAGLSPWERFRRASVALALAAELASARAQLAALGGEPAAGRWALDVRQAAELRAQAAEAQRGFAVGLAVFAEPEEFVGEAESLFAKTLSDLGFAVVPVPLARDAFEEMQSGRAEALREQLEGRAEVLAAFRLAAVPVGEERLAGQPAYFYEARGRAFLRELASGELIAAATVPASSDTRKGSSRPERAEAAALKAGAEELANALRARIAEAITGTARGD